MDEKQIQANRRFFHSAPTRIPISHCYDFIIYPNGLLKKFPKKSSGNEKVLLYFLTRRMSVRDAKGNTTDFKDIAETFWFKRETIARLTGMRPERISESIASLVNHGILVHKVDRGVGQWIAFSKAAISEWKEYSDKLLNAASEEDYDADTETVPRQVRKPYPGKYGNRTQASTETVPGSYIEESGNVIRVADSVDGWSSASQPAKRSGYSEIVGIAQELQVIFQNRSRYIDYATINLFLAGLVDDAGGDMEAARRFTRWVKEYVYSTHGPQGIPWKDWKMEELGKRYQQSMAH